MSVELIKKVIPFNEHDLESNSQGKVSAAQLMRLKDEVGDISRKAGIGFLVSVALFFICAVIFSGLEYKKPLLRNLDALPIWFMFLFILTIIILCTSIFVLLWGAFKSKMYDGRLIVKVTEGKIERFTPGVDESAHRIKVGETEFYVDEKTHDAFTNEYYRVYFLDSSDILSVEEFAQDRLKI